jgi:hypothetical protein
MTVRDVDPRAQDKQLHQRHINPRMQVSRRVCGWMSANAVDSRVTNFVISKAYRLIT